MWVKRGAVTGSSPSCCNSCRRCTWFKNDSWPLRLATPATARRFFKLYSLPAMQTITSPVRPQPYPAPRGESGPVGEGLGRQRAVADVADDKRFSAAIERLLLSV